MSDKLRLEIEHDWQIGLEPDEFRKLYLQEWTPNAKCTACGRMGYRNDGDDIRCFEKNAKGERCKGWMYGIEEIFLLKNRPEPETPK